LALVDDVATHINEAVRAQQNREEQRRLEEQFLSKITFVSPGRLLVRFGELMKKCRNRDERYTLFLFNDLLVYARKVGWKYKLHRRIEIDGAFQANDLNDGKFSFEIVNAKKSFVVYAKDKAEMDGWLEDINECIEERKKTIGGDNAVAARPVWKQDQTEKHCPLCKNKFGLIRRRHHCRKCGSLCCDDCSSARTILDKNEGEQRICDNCEIDVQIAPQNPGSTTLVPTTATLENPNKPPSANLTSPVTVPSSPILSPEVIDQKTATKDNKDKDKDKPKNKFSTLDNKDKDKDKVSDNDKPLDKIKDSKPANQPKDNKFPTLDKNKPRDKDESKPHDKTKDSKPANQSKDNKFPTLDNKDLKDKEKPKDKFSTLDRDQDQDVDKDIDDNKDVQAAEDDHYTIPANFDKNTTFTIPKTETLTGGSKKYTVYIIKVRGAEDETVGKRFSHFTGFDKFLRKRYPKLMSHIPLPPPSRYFGNFSAEVIEERRIGFEDYLQAIVAHKPMWEELAKFTGIPVQRWKQS